ncbi:N-acetylglucosamine-6-phosphate deacetylase [Psychrobium sp. 1_MG-2023]|uniref:N-acetylglucosamine-6-phosphate deacetylase n=1 Tax=Psychrobium sp. 1_MG-2023 TaxID=3062624 RepID=UPI000C338143|nr:N-acetylglucosamine-6-phosphate deacetylase [Psychrobium sp. 1_MG-2023]MDP2559536.1 N-acetylglucosamine-6-phosphate deacetylase [Psychrobium sp. 1_MG-2023]PKF59376.1 N-acetylglucosamine-6-phosphate deacetylase [Alteromonadales bacterium alter-6D02]
MTQLTISADKIFDGQQYHEQAQLSIDNGVITSITAIDGSASEHISGLIAPGFVDLQVNGGGGALLNTHATVDGLKTMFQAHRQFGTTAMLPTLITDTVEVMSEAADAISQAIAQGVDGIIGVHFEGPHLSIAKKGAHSAEFIREISEPEWAVLERKDLGLIAVTVAPENVSTDDIKRMVALGIKVFLGHSNADFSTAQAAVDAGATGFTHLFNAMSAFTSREPGMVGAALLNDSAVCGLIVDGHHVDYTSCKVALKAKPQGSLVLVTDAMSVVGTDIERFAFFDREIVRTGDKLNSTTGELAGSALDMASAVRNTHRHLDVSLAESLNMASLYPAQYLSLDKSLGRLIVGARADFIALNDNVEVTRTWVAGKE